MIIERALTEEDIKSIQNVIAASKIVLKYAVQGTCIVAIGMLLLFVPTKYNSSLALSFGLYLLFTVPVIIFFAPMIYSSLKTIAEYKRHLKIEKLKIIKLENLPCVVAEKKGENSLYFYQYTHTQMICIEYLTTQEEPKLHPNNNLDIEFYSSNGLDVLFNFVPHGELQQPINTISIKGRFKKHLNLKSKYLNPNEFCIVDGTLDKLANIID